MPKRRFGRPPCFRNIWRDPTNDLAWFEFWDGSIYEYTPSGSASDACDCATFDPHGTTFDTFVRIARGGSGYTKVSSVPGTATLVYSYPPYDNVSPSCGFVWVPRQSNCSVTIASEGLTPSFSFGSLTAGQCVAGMNGAGLSITTSGTLTVAWSVMLNTGFSCQQAQIAVANHIFFNAISFSGSTSGSASITVSPGTYTAALVFGAANGPGSMTVTITPP